MLFKVFAKIWPSSITITILENGIQTWAAVRPFAKCPCIFRSFCKKKGHCVSASCSASAICLIAPVNLGYCGDFQELFFIRSGKIFFEYCFIFRYEASVLKRKDAWILKRLTFIGPNEKKKSRRVWTRCTARNFISFWSISGNQFWMWKNIISTPVWNLTEFKIGPGPKIVIGCTEVTRWFESDGRNTSFRCFVKFLKSIFLF